MEIRTDRLGLLLDQLGTSVDMSRERLDGIDDEEFLWEPAPGSWSIRRRSEARTTRVWGAGEWVMEWEDDPPIVPVQTIAYRIAHLYSGFWSRWEWTFGARQAADDDIVYSPVASEALDLLWGAVDRWRTSLATLTDEQMDMVGFGQYPGGMDPHVPFIGIVWWENREFIHHMSEVALLRDLYRVRART